MKTTRIPAPSAPRPPSIRRREPGIALVAVLWMTAALAILVSGMTYAVRVDTRLAAQQVDSARARALLDGALRVAAAELVVMPQPPTAPSVFIHRVGDLEMHTDVRLANGFISINSAPPGMLADLFMFAAGLSEDDALVLAERIVDWRDPDDEPQPHGAEREQYLAAGLGFGPRNEEFRHPDDLGQVLGMTPAVHDKIAGLITVSKGAGGAIDPLAASEAVLNVLARGNTSVVQRIVDARAAGDAATVDLAGIDPANVRQSRGNEYRLVAELKLPGGATWTRTAWLSTRQTMRPSGVPGLPWTWLYAEAPRQVNDMDGDNP